MLEFIINYILEGTAPGELVYRARGNLRGQQLEFRDYIMLELTSAFFTKKVVAQEVLSVSTAAGS